MTHFKKTIINKKLWLLFFIFFLFSGSITEAQNKVVVIPLFDDQKAGSVNVYDSSSPPQYLGILIGYTPSQQSRDGVVDLVQIFIPELKKLTYITLNATDHGWQIAGHIFANGVYYEEASCTGNPFIDYSYFIVRDYIGNLYYSENQRTLISFISERDSTGCNAASGHRSAFLSEILEEKIPFTLPVTLPLRYELQKDN